MDTPDIDEFGMLESPDPEERLEVPAEDDGLRPQAEGTDDAGTAVETPLQKADSSRAEQWLAAAISMAGGRGNTAVGRDLIINNGLPEDRPATAKAVRREPSGRGLQHPEALRRLAERYVTPPGLLDDASDQEAALTALANRKVLMLDAPVLEGGQFSAGLRLAYELQLEIPRLLVREELLDPDTFNAADLFVEHEQAAVLIDLRWADVNSMVAVERSLVGLATQLKDYTSYLILILPQDTGSKFDNQLPGAVHKLKKTTSEDVFAKHLGHAESYELIKKANAAEKLELLWPPAVAAVAARTHKAIEQGIEPVPALREALQRKTSNLSASLRETISARQEEDDDEWLAMLLAASVLERHTPPRIIEASDELLKLSGVPLTESVRPLMHRSPYTRLERLTDKWIDSDTWELKPAGSGEQVLQHFWREHAKAQRALLPWFQGLPRSMTNPSADELERIADRTASLASVAGAKFATSLAGAWAKTEAGHASNGTETSTRAVDQSCRSVAVRLLTTAATDTTLGQHVRNQLWDWARKGTADQQLLTAEVCAGIGESFPKHALTRLKHVAGSENEVVQRSVLSAIGQIGAELGTSRLLRYLVQWFEKPSVNRLRVLSEGVGNVIAKSEERVDNDAARSFWDHALGTISPDDLRTLTQAWLRTAVRLPPADHGPVIEPLVEATRREPRRIADLHYASRPWPGEVPGSSEEEQLVTVVHQLRTRLDEIDPIWNKERG